MRGVRIEQGNSFNIVLTNEEITSVRLEDEPILKEDEEVLGLLFRFAHVVPWRASTGMLEFDYVGPQAADMLGYPLEMWYGEGFWTSHVHPEDLQQVTSVCRQARIDTPFIDLEYRVSGLDGRIVWIRHLGVAVKEDEEVRLRGYFIDITDRKLASAALKEKELRLTLSERSVSDGLFLVNVQPGSSYSFASVNPSFLRITGLTRQQIIGKPVVEVVGGLAATSVLARFNEAIVRNRTVVWEERVQFSSGERICEIVATPITNETENRVQILAAIQDVTADEEARSELLKSFTLNQAVLASLPNPVAILDAHGEIIAANQAWNRDRKKASGAAPEGVVAGENYLEICKKAAELGVASSRDKYDGIRLVIDGGRDHFEMEYLSRETKGGTNWYKMMVTPSPATGGAVVSYVDITAAKLAEERVRDLSGRLIHGQEEERKRIARELHDDVNQRLALLAIELEQFAREKGESDVEVQRRAQDLCGLAQSISSDVHRLSHKLHPSKLDHLGLIDAARDFCTEISQHHGVHVDFFHRDVPDRIPGEISLCIFRIIQESLQNVVKHSGAKQAYVGLVGQGGEIHLEVSDPGAGFDSDSDKGKAGLGLVSMRERVRFAGGDMWIRSRRSHGTRINVKMPLRAPALKKAPMAILIDN
jgi:PAS domain S-box-containing protein